MFTQPVESVSGTQMFVRLIGGAPPRQILVYSMEFSAAGEDLAMVLPLPTPQNSAEDAVQFVNLEAYPEFFDDMGKGFAPPPSLSRSAEANAVSAGAVLEVHSVGAFEASFVPKNADFSRLDPRFQLPADLWAKLPGGQDYGFAVFKLKGGQSQRIHPMALTFPTRNTQQIFFPTVHVHAGAFEPRAAFDHTLYFQGSDTLRLPLAFDTGTHRLGRLVGGLMGVTGGAKASTVSHGAAKEFMSVDKTEDLVDADMKVQRFVLQERLPNRDVVLWPKYHARAGEYP